MTLYTDISPYCCTVLATRHARGGIAPYRRPSRNLTIRRPLTQSEVAALLGISRSLVWKIERTAIAKMRTALGSARAARSIIEPEHPAGGAS